MRKAIIPLLLLLAVSCSTYTIAEGRANISIPKQVNAPSTKLIPSSSAQGAKASAIFLELGFDPINTEEISDAVEMLKELNPDLLILIGSEENQSAFKQYFANIFELNGTTIILSDRPFNTDTISLYVGDIPAILAETEFPLLDSNQ